EPRERARPRHRRADALAEAGQVELPLCVGKAEADAGGGHHRHPQHHHPIDPDARREQSSRNRDREDAEGGGGGEGAGTCPGKVELVFEVWEEGGERGEERRFEQRDDAHHEEEPPHLGRSYPPSWCKLPRDTGSIRLTNMPELDDPSARARNQAMCRAVNERVRSFRSALDDEAPAARARFYCECGAPDCGRWLDMNFADYDFVRELAGRRAV